MTDSHSSEEIQVLTDTHESLMSRLSDTPWILQGQTFEIRRPDWAKSGSRYVWSIKLKGQKQHTRTLSKEQFLAFNAAIQANRQVEKLLKEIRSVSEELLLKSLPGVRKRASRKPRSKNGSD